MILNRTAKVVKPYLKKKLSMQSWFIILLLPSDNRSFLYISNRIFHQSQPAVCQARCCGSAGPPHCEPEGAKQRHGQGSAALQASHKVPRQRKQYPVPCVNFYSFTLRA